jgi:ribonuclease BN (tRNA processing enzyme)
MKETAGRDFASSRRALLRNLILLTGAGVGASMLGLETSSLRDVFGQAAGAAGGRGTTASQGMRLILLGTQGGPNLNLTRAETSSVVVVDGQPYLVDCGYGAVRSLTEAGITLNTVRNIFLSHLHDDHTADLAALLSLKWTSGTTNPSPAAVYGPYGTKAMVEGAMAFFKANVDIRSVDEGRTVRPEAIFSGKDLAAPAVTEVFRDERVTVTAVENTHFPERAKAKMPYRSFAYRFNTADRSIVLSGDTAYSANLVALARGCDYFVCEAMTSAARQQYAADAGITNANPESIGRHILETHSSTEDVGRMATEAKVKTVVLYHLLPGANRGGAPDDTYISEVKNTFSGPVIVGRDQLRIPQD